MKIIKSISGGEAIIASVIENNADTIFGIPGAQIYPLFDGIFKSKVNLITPRHEQTAAYMAMGYAKSTGKTGVFSVVPGPGILNTTAALCTAMGNCTPLVALTGQVPTSFVGKGRGHLHELTDQSGTLRTLIKEAISIDNPQNTSRQVNEAFRLAQSGRPGPVSVEMCWDTMADVSDFTIDEPVYPSELDESIDLDSINDAVKMLVSAKKPMIMCGSGALDAAEEVLALAQLFNAPVSAFRSGRGIVSEDSPLGVPPVAARELWGDVDVLIGIGTRLEMPYMRWGNYMNYESAPSSGPKLIRIDIDPKQMDIFKPDVAVVADAKKACRLLFNKLSNKVKPNAFRLDEISTAKHLAWKAIQKMQPQMSYLSVIRDVLPRDGFYIPELSQMGFTTWAGGLPVLAPRTFIDAGFQGTLGYGFPTALGVKVANPDKAVLSVCGDGGFMFSAQELITASEHNIGLITLVFNNQGYGNVMRDQKMGYGGRLSGSELTTPDFVKLAESCHVRAHRVFTPQQLKPVLEMCINKNQPALIEIVGERGEEVSPWEFINMTSSLKDKERVDQIW
ncbi:thiamine pyrophosphate-dependent enzyme [Marinomonas arenicola]|uniref:Thiamine pyrophosphate-dependent enzyme n=1 Tax=Marinomonas arenicola TaxID=569601 RepID=A0ABU9GCN7_9GAMM